MHWIWSIELQGLQKKKYLFWWDLISQTFFCILELLPCRVTSCHQRDMLCSVTNRAVQRPKSNFHRILVWKIFQICPISSSPYCSTVRGFIGANNRSRSNYKNKNNYKGILCLVFFFGTLFALFSEMPRSNRPYVGCSFLVP